jgi:hypothetical protein
MFSVCKKVGAISSSSIAPAPLVTISAKEVNHDLHFLKNTYFNNRFKAVDTHTVEVLMRHFDLKELDDLFEVVWESNDPSEP